jgi:hypothetical protein
MPEEQLRGLFRWGPIHPIGDPPMLLESILQQVEVQQQKQIIGLYLESITATIEANLKFMQGLRSIVSGGQR